MIHPVVCNPVLSPVVRVTDPVRWRAGRLAPSGAILYWDASKNKPLLPVTYNGKYLVVKNV